MSEIKQPLTLDQAAKAYAKMLYPGGGPNYDAAIDGFTDGAQWQKDQDLNKLNKALEQIKEMGAIIRQLDENSVHSEYWLMDGDYVPDTQYLENL